ncbi:MAG TPA: lasso peptide biosynthesis B2 protein [Pyrinomonadaceae bacterium]|jgi:hypothetical protein
MSKSSRGTVKKLFLLLPRAGRKAVRHPRESMLMVRMAMWIIVVSALLKLASLPRVLQLVSVRVPSNAPAVDQSEALKLVHAIDLLLGIDVPPFRPSCWKRAMILQRYLALSRIDTTINFGVRKDNDGQIDGHAWLERHGKPIFEATFPAYAVTFRFPTVDGLPH